MQDGQCDNGCKNGYFGDFCDKKCGNCTHEKCDRNDGHCTEGCKDGNHGNSCNETCSENCFGIKCDMKKGRCTEGCREGWYGDFCEKKCGNCSDGKCDQHSGECKLCLNGFHGSVCDQQCPAECPTKSCQQVDGSCDNAERKRIILAISGIVIAVIIVLVAVVVGGGIVYQKRFVVQKYQNLSLSCAQHFSLI